MDACYWVSMLYKVANHGNLMEAARHVIRNKGAPGADGMTVDELLPYLEDHIGELRERIIDGKYWPDPVRRKEIPKPDGSMRMLGIPSVIDRMVQQAVAQVLEPIFEPDFSEHSWGFRPGRSAHDAMKEAKGYYDQGYAHVVDLDVKAYFDTICHDKLMEFLGKKIIDKGLLRLIRRFLRSGVMINGLVSPTESGVPQGGPLSAILSNVYLDKFDKMLEGRGLKFVRYADDCNIYVKSKRAAERVMQSSTRFLEGELRLKVNQAKSMVGSPLKLKFLGFSLYNIKGVSGIRVHEKSRERFKDKVRQITRRNRGRSVKAVCQELKVYATGWIAYYGLASLKSRLKEWDAWIRAKMRTYIWKQWKKVRTKARNLRRLGAGREDAWKWANTRKGYWRIAHSQVLCFTMTNEYLEGQGLMSLSRIHLKMQVNKALRA